MTANVQKAIEAIVRVDTIDELREVSRFLRDRWNDINRANAQKSAAEFRKGDMVKIKRRDRVGEIVKFGPKNIIVIVKRDESKGIFRDERWRVHPDMLEKVS